MLPVVHALPQRRSLRITLQFLGALAIFAVGVSVGEWYANTRGKLLSSVYSSTEEQIFHTYLDAQSMSGTDVQHEAALRQFIAVLKRQEAYPTALFSPSVAGIHEMLAYLRLSKLARDRGDAGQAHAYILDAMSVCQQKTHWDKCSAEQMDNLGDRLKSMSQSRYSE